MPKFKKAKRSLMRRLTKRPLLAAVVAVILLAGGGFAYAQLRDQPPPDSPAPNSSVEEEYINLDPPTEEEKKETQENKKSLAEDKPAPPPQPSSGKKGVTPVITSATRSEVRAYISDVIEDGGTCTATATRSGSSPKSKSSVGFSDAQTTICAPIEWSLPSGQWSVIVTYSSSTSQGKSEAQPVN